ncbi:dinitrogenase iron-molybdenum cofactor [Agarivorans sp. B2Z047]|uniref:NifB/NifX family molybdenum-iron cluster-binding protein n=1 Tax=Agarivorans sp. B2Z047 TaxID=2652721 RepID=UPI00128BF0A9|nr:NifB/NifX family molybdenum-iron cluster-binding protein [Agarivorans sp. B2Z047]MPW30937.1 dinitrogenase iron-molybdenum cofactor [Agarivorans sp. B2Z047]UQN40835.1 dinitrogenase iron-molybdenum cofactor biosynthesis protein [Agarivorans sp. B2Z047]
MKSNINDNLALRLAVASKAIPDIELKQFVALLVGHCGEPLTEKKLRALSPKVLREVFQSSRYNVERSQVNQLHAILSSEQISPMEAPVVPEQTLLKGPIVQLAVSSNNLERIDGHFGSCLRFLIYQVSAQGFQLVDVRPVIENLSGDARTSYLIDLIGDCQLLATLSIGGPAAARVSRADILPLKQLTPQAARSILERLQTVMDCPPRWLAKLLEKQEAEACLL